VADITESTRLTPSRHRRIDQARADEHVSSGAGLFRSIAELETAILAYIDATNSSPKSIRWTKSANNISGPHPTLPQSPLMLK